MKHMQAVVKAAHGIEATGEQLALVLHVSDHLPVPAGYPVSTCQVLQLVTGQPCYAEHGQFLN